METLIPHRFHTINTQRHYCSHYIYIGYLDSVELQFFQLQLTSSKFSTIKDGRIRVAVTDDLFCCIATKRSTLTCLDKTEDIGCWLGKSIGVYVSLLCLLISIFCSKGVRELGLLCACYYVSSIDWRLKNEKSLYLFKKSLLIAIQNSYKNTIKYSLQFPYILSYLVKNSLSYEYFRSTRHFGPTWTHIYSQNVVSIYSSHPAE